jgi:S1-C subfamily serine protease
MIRHFYSTLQDQVAFDKMVDIAIAFILKTNAESIKYQKSCSFEIRDLFVQVPLRLGVNNHKQRIL